MHDTKRQANIIFIFACGEKVSDLQTAFTLLIAILINAIIETVTVSIKIQIMNVITLSSNSFNQIGAFQSIHFTPSTGTKFLRRQHRPAHLHMMEFLMILLR